MYWTVYIAHAVCANYCCFNLHTNHFSRGGVPATHCKLHLCKFFEDFAHRPQCLVGCAPAHTVTIVQTLLNILHSVCVCMVGCVPPAASLVINWILVTPFSLAYKSWVLCTAFHSNTTTWCNAQCAICTKVHFPHCVLHAIHRSYELTRLNVQILNIRQYSVLIIKYIILYWLDVLLSRAIFVCLNATILCLNLFHQISPLFLMLVEEIGGRKDKGSHRKSRPPLGEGKEVDLEWGQKFGLAKKPTEWICWRQEELLRRG